MHHKLATLEEHCSKVLRLAVAYIDSETLVLCCILCLELLCVATANPAPCLHNAVTVQTLIHHECAKAAVRERKKVPVVLYDIQMLVYVAWGLFAALQLVDQFEDAFTNGCALACSK